MREGLALGLGFIFNFIYSFIGNYGLTIVLFTIIYKVLLFPISYYQQKSTLKTRKMQQEIEKIRKKYPGNTKKINEEMVDVYRKNNISPLIGLSTLAIGIFRILVIFAVFTLVNDPLKYVKKIDGEKIKTAEKEMYISKILELNKDQDKKELEKKDIKELRNWSKIKRPQLELIRNYREKDNQFNINMNFLGLDLIETPIDKLQEINLQNKETLKNLTVLIMPIVYLAITMINMAYAKKKSENEKKQTQKLLQEKNDNNIDNKDDEMLNSENFSESMEEASKSMMKIMPIFMLIVTLTAPQCLALYWIIQSVLSIAETELLKKITIKEEKAEA